MPKDLEWTERAFYRLFLDGMEGKLPRKSEQVQTAIIILALAGAETAEGPLYERTIREGDDFTPDKEGTLEVTLDEVASAKNFVILAGFRAGLLSMGKEPDGSEKEFEDLTRELKTSEAFTKPEDFADGPGDTSGSAALEHLMQLWEAAFRAGQTLGREKHFTS